MSVGERAGDADRPLDVALPEAESVRASLQYSNAWHTIARLHVRDDDGPVLVAAHNAFARAQDGVIAATPRLP